MKIEMYQDYKESGFDGAYEKTTYYRLLRDEASANAVVILEKEVVRSSSPRGSEPSEVVQYQIAARDLVAFILEKGESVRPR